MRKKSHISLAGYLVGELRLDSLLKHKKAFYLGSILPDLNPKMVKAPHEFETSFEKIRERIEHLVKAGQSGACSESAFWRKAGVIMHYLADYFTFPHNSNYDGNLKDHCVYEGEMKNQFRCYVRTPEAKMIFRSQKKAAVKKFEPEKSGSPFRGYSGRSLHELFHYIEESHAVYMQERHSVEEDCRWILEICSGVMTAILLMAKKEYITAAGYAAA